MFPLYSRGKETLMEKKRLSKALAAAGVASRRACEELIFEGRVQVNGETIKLPQHHVDWENDRITVDGETLKAEEKKLYFILNKPVGYLCTSTRPGKKPIVLDLFPDVKERLFTVGRLDRETSGLLIVTNDGNFANEVIHPRSNIIKEYIVKAHQEITPTHLEALTLGARVDNKWVRPILVQKIRKGTLKIQVKEGKKHEVRILAERAGLKVRELSRIRIGDLNLGTLPLGKYRALNEKEKKQLLTPSHIKR